MMNIKSDVEYFSLVLEGAEKDTKPALDLDDLLYLRDIKNRRLRINCEITAGSVEDAVQWILRFNAEDDMNENRSKFEDAKEQRKPIKLYICSPGGSVMDGMKLVDAIICSKTPIWTIVTSYAYSMACEIAMMGHKRFAMPNATFLIHEGDIGLADSTTKAQDLMDFYSKFRKQRQELILDHTVIPADKMTDMQRIEWYITAQEALELGMIDEIVAPGGKNLSSIL